MALAVVYLLGGAASLATGTGLAFGLGAGLMVGGVLLLAAGVFEARGQADRTPPTPPGEPARAARPTRPSPTTAVRRGA